MISKEARDCISVVRYQLQKLIGVEQRTKVFNEVALELSASLIISTVEMPKGKTQETLTGDESADALVRRIVLFQTALEKRVEQGVVAMAMEAAQKNNASKIEIVKG